MKKLLIFAAVAASMFTSCDIERTPYDKYLEDDIANDKEAVNVILNGCYGQLRDWSDVMHRVGEYAGDNMMIRGSSTDAFYEFISYQHSPQNYRLNTFWNNSYKVISQSSDLMKSLEEGTSPEMDQKLGEAYYLRGMMYFYLCRAYGRPYDQSPETNLGVPILNGLPADLDNLDLPDRSTVKETYTQAVSDLREGERLMNEARSAIYASKEVAQAMLSRVYLYMSGTWKNPNTQYADSAIYYADKVLASGRYTLLNTEAFKKFNILPPDDAAQTETIFAVKRVSSEYSGDDHNNGIGSMYATIDGMGWGEMYASAKYLDLLNRHGQKADARSAFIDPQYVDTEGEKNVFRFIAPLYKFKRDGSKEQNGYGYTQVKLDSLNGEIKKPLQVTIKHQTGVKPDPANADKDIPVWEEKIYILKTIDEADDLYEINHIDGEIQGYKDHMMLINIAYPMFYITKCSQQNNDSHLHSPTISRLAEIYLIKAESFAKKGDYVLAKENLNVVRERSLPGLGYISLDASNAAVRISEERQLEMAYEADRSFDVYRNGETLVRAYPGPHNAMEEIEATDRRVVQYIPQDQINAYNSIGCTLTQNP